MKLPERQMEILKLIATGDWEIGIEAGYNVRAWMQKGGLGHGGEAQDVNYNTFHSLRNKGLILRNSEPQFTRLQHYHITQLGMDIVK